MTVLTMSPTRGDLLKFELNGNYCRETITLKSGTAYALGSVLAKITASAKYRLSPAAQVVGDEGAETATAVLLEAADATGGDKTGLVVASNGRPVAQPLEKAMKKQALRMGAATAVTFLLSGWALAQSAEPGHGFDPPSMRGGGPGGMYGMHRQMGPGMHRQMGPECLVRWGRECMARWAQA